MATENHTIAGSGYGSPYVDTLVWGNAGWTLGSGSISYFLGDANAASAGNSPTANTADVVAWNADQSASFVSALASFSAVCAMTFGRSADVASANLVEWQIGNGAMSDQFDSQHEIPTAPAGHNGNSDQVWGRYNADRTDYFDNVQLGGAGHYAYLRQIAHAVGLANADYGGTQPDAAGFPGVFDQDAGEPGYYEMIRQPNTVLGFAASTPDTAYGFMGTLGALDIAALQAMYGVNNNTATRDDTYVMPTANQAGTGWTCIWDCGGSDTIDNSASTLASTIDLRAATLIGAHAGGYLSQNAGIYGGYTIANGVVIEQAKGGSGADVIIGNAAQNTLFGNGGVDTLVGGAGSDSLVGGADADVLYGDVKPGGPSGVTMGSGAITKAAGFGNSDFATALDVTAGYSLASNADIQNATTVPHLTVHATGDGTIDYYKIELNAGSTLTLDIDNTTGGLDTHMFLYSGPNFAQDIITSDNDSQLTEGAGGSSVTTDSLIVTQIDHTGVYYIRVRGTAQEVPVGTTYDLNISVTNPEDAGTGSAGADTLDGGAGADSMVGGAGNDTYYVDDAGDKVVEAVGQGTDSVHTTLASYTLAANVERLYFDDGGIHTGKGNALSNLIYGNSGVDRFIIDAGGNDTYSGGSGEDFFDGRTAKTGMTLWLDDQTHNAGSVSGDTFASVEKFFGSDTAADVMTTGAARAKFYGYAGNDTLTGGSSVDVLDGGVGNDSLVGGAGRDALYGGYGDDTMTGGAGADLFTYVTQRPYGGIGHDVITDFEDGIDRLKVLSYVADSFDDFTVAGNGTHHVVLTLNETTNTITLDNASANITITAADFLFY